MIENHAENFVAIRRKTKQLTVGNILIGGDAPIAVQSMTNTDSEDYHATNAQVSQLTQAGADIVRISVPTSEAAQIFGRVAKQAHCPLVADIHFDYKMAILAAENGAACLRINPGNIGAASKIAEVINCAKYHGIPIRIGVNAGSLEKDLQIKYGEPNADALVESAMRHVDILLSNNFDDFKLSIKASNPFLAVQAYRKIADKIEQPLHIGITEAGGLRTGTVKSTIGLGLLLMEGIGDTIRVSLAADPVHEVRVAWDLLKVLGLRKRGVSIIACPSCSRQNFDVIGVVNQLEERVADIKQDMDIAVIGCYVNGPGESKVAQIGVTGAAPNHLVYIDGKPSFKTDSNNLVADLEKAIRDRDKKLSLAAANLIASSSNMVNLTID